MDLLFHLGSGHATAVLILASCVIFALAAEAEPQRLMTHRRRLWRWFSTIPGCWRLVSVPPGFQVKVCHHVRHVMRNRKATEVDADVEARIAQIEQMTLDQIAVFQCRILTDITTGRISPREASAIDRALRKRLKAIEQELREAG